VEPNIAEQGMSSREYLRRNDVLAPEELSPARSL
jgi:hypothetical protein